MAFKTPDRFPGAREEEEFQFSDNAGDPSVEGALRYTGSEFLFKDAGSVFNPRPNKPGVLQVTTHTNFTGSASYVTLQHFLFKGSTAWPGFANIKVVARLGSLLASPSQVRIYDVTNSLEICVVNVTSFLDTIVETGTLGNIPAGPAVWEIQARAPNASGIFVAAVALNFFSPGYITDASDFICVSEVFGIFVPPATLVHEWEADSGIVVGDGAALDAWSPVVGGVSLLQAGAPKPIYRATAATNGLPSVEFVATDYMDAAVGTIAQPDTIILIAEFPDTNQPTEHFDGVSARQTIFTQPGPVWWVYAGASVSTGGTPAVSTGLHFVVAQFNGASSFLQIDGIKSAALSVGSGSLSPFRLGASNTGAFGPNMYVHAASIWSGVMNTAQIDAARSAAQTKWSTP